jgi:dipeptidyl peptidase IV (DPP IV)-like protein
VWACCSLSTRTHTTKTLHAGYFPRFVAASPTDGFLLFVDGTTVYAARFDVKSLTLTSAPPPVLNDLVVDRLDAQLDVSASGRAVAQTGDLSAGRDFVINRMTPAGMMPLVTKPGVYRRPAVSPDGRRVAFQIDNPVGSDSLADAWIYDTEARSTSRLTFNNGELPRWSPDGRHIAYRANDGLYWINSDGTSGSVKLTSGLNQFPMSFTPDARCCFNRPWRRRTISFSSAFPTE